jgi:uncharacterized RDD family membrane protein YckC
VSDAPQGPGWWQASDGKWYAPEQASGGQAMAGGSPGAPAAGGSAFGELADFGTRAIGLVIDIGVVIAVAIVGFVISAIFGAVADVLGLLIGLVFYLVYLGLWFYYGYLVGTKGASPGMAVMGLKCVNEQTGQTIGAGPGIIRGLAHILDNIICYIGWFFPLWDAKRQTLADKVMKTVVLSGQPKAQFGPDLFKP